MTTNGNDLIYGTMTSKTIDGRGGTDTVWYDRVTGNVALDVADSGTFVYKSNGTFDTLLNIEAVSGSASQNDFVLGLGSSRGLTIDLKFGSLQVDGTSRRLSVTRFEHMIGSHYNDRLTGTDGNNWMNGSSGGDVLTGRAGADTFSYDNWTDSYVSSTQYYVPGGTIDIITDFQSGIDKIDLRCVAQTTGRPSVWVGDRSGWGQGAWAIGTGQVGLIGNRVVANLGNNNLLQIDIFNTGSTFASRPNVQWYDVLL